MLTILQLAHLPSYFQVGCLDDELRDRLSLGVSYPQGVPFLSAPLLERFYLLAVLISNEYADFVFVFVLGKCNFFSCVAIS